MPGRRLLATVKNGAITRALRVFIAKAAIVFFMPCAKPLTSAHTHVNATSEFIVSWRVRHASIYLQEEQSFNSCQGRKTSTTIHIYVVANTSGPPKSIPL